MGTVREYDVPFRIETEDCQVGGDYLLTFFAWDNDGEAAMWSHLFTADVARGGGKPAADAAPSDRPEPGIQPKHGVQVARGTEIRIHFEPRNPDRFGAHILRYLRQGNKAVRFDKMRDTILNAKTKTFPAWLADNKPHRYTPTEAGELVYIFVAWDLDQKRRLKSGKRDLLIQRRIAFKVT